MGDIKWKNIGHDFTYSLTYDHSDIVVSLDSHAKDRIKTLLDSNSPDGGFKQALNCFAGKYYTDIGEKPWEHHPQNNTEIEAEVNKRWPLAWYWKLLLPVLKDWKPECRDQWRIKICQVRQWVMVLIYEYRNGSRRLLRPPLFGPSERISQADQYWLLLSFKQEIENYWTATQEFTGAEKSIEETYVLGRHDVIYRIRNIQTNESKRKEPILRIRLQSQLILDPHITKKEDFPKSITNMLKLDNVDCVPEPVDIRNPYCLLSLPAMVNPSSKHEDVQLLLSSNNVCRAIHKLSEVWNDPTAKSIFILAPPGSGKEILASSIYDFRKFDGEYVSYALSPDSNLAETNQKMLFFRDMSDAEAGAEVVAMINQELKDDAKLIKNIRDGLIFKARKGVLFLDEIDKDKEGKTRSGLLRLLENDEFAVYDTTLVIKMPNSITPVYVFAGSKTLSGLLELEPSDFWTRIGHFVEMKHPLACATKDEQFSICQDYFLMFWNRHLPKFFQRSHLLPVPFFPKQYKTSRRFLHQYSLGLFWALMDDNVKCNLSKIFSNSVLSDDSNPEEISIRNIRSIVGRVTFSIVELVLYDKNFEKPLAKIRKMLANLPKGVLLDKGLSWYKLLARFIGGEPLNEIELGLKSGASKDDTTTIQNMVQELGELTNQLQEEIRQIIEDAIKTIPSLHQHASPEE